MNAALFLWITWIPLVYTITKATSWIVSYNGELFLRYRNELRRLPSEHRNETIAALLGEAAFSLSIPGVKDEYAEFHYPERIQILSQDDLANQRLAVTADLPVLVMKDNSLDEKLRIHIATIYALQGSPMLHQIMEIGPYINPSLLYFQRRWLVASCASWWFPGMNDDRDSSNTVFFKWTTQFYPIAVDGQLAFVARHREMQRTQQKHPVAPPPVPPERKHMGVSDILDSIQGEAVEGQDPRVLSLDDDSFLVFFVKERLHRRFHGLLVVGLNRTTHELQIEHHIHDISFNGSRSEKNWVPFLLPDVQPVSNARSSLADRLRRVFFVQRINPMVVVQLGDFHLNADKDMVATAHVVSIASMGHSSYRYGEFRGGTNAVDLGDRFLAIFHSTAVLPKASTKTYFMGAYTFSKTSPFRLLAISSEPVVVPWMYEGPWNPFSRNRKVDYCVFPVSLSFLPPDSLPSNVSSAGPHVHDNIIPFDPHRYRRGAARRFDHGAARAQNNPVDDHTWTGEHGDVSLLLSMGYQDLGGLLAVLSLQQVLRSLEPVVYCTDEAAAAKHPVLFRLYCT